MQKSHLRISYKFKKTPVPIYSKPKIIVSLLLCVFCFTSLASSQYSDTRFLEDLEDLLSSQSDLLMSFDYHLHETQTNLNEKANFLNSFDDLLTRQAKLLTQFEDLLSENWKMMSIEEQEIFLESFSNLIKKESTLVSSFEAHCDVNSATFSPEIEVKFLASFEDLLGRMANLLNGYEELFKMKHGGIIIERSVDKVTILKGEFVTYSYTVKNAYEKKKLVDIIIVDDMLGTIADNISLEPGESRSFTKTANLVESTCNQAEAIGKDQEGKLIGDESGVLCVLVRNGGLAEPEQYGQYCETSKVEGNGTFDAATFIIDSKIAMQYSKSLSGNGELALDSNNILSEMASKLLRPVQNKTVPLNFYGTAALQYSGQTPMKSLEKLSSREFDGGIGANIVETFSVSQIEKRQTSFLASTDPGTNEKNLTKAMALENSTPVYLVGIDTENSFNGTWETESRLHKLLWKDVYDRQSFIGKFETSRLIKFHEKPAYKAKSYGCEGIDC
jgi:hypothetical protein